MCVYIYIYMYMCMHISIHTYSSTSVMRPGSLGRLRASVRASPAAAPYRIVSYRIVSYRIVSYRIVSFQSTLIVQKTLQSTVIVQSATYNFETTFRPVIKMVMLIAIVIVTVIVIVIVIVIIIVIVIVIVINSKRGTLTYGFYYSFNILSFQQITTRYQ